jgi:hypothetical protein
MFTVESGTFLQNLRTMQVQAAGVNTLAFEIVVPPEMVWWYWQEFGTALYAEKGTDNPFGYTVAPVHGKALRFYDRGVGDFRITKETFVFGIPPHHMVTNSIPEIRVLMSTSVIEYLQSSNYDLNIVKQRMRTEMMPKVKEIVRRAFEVALDLSNRPGGKLDVPAHMEFDTKAIIVDVSE